MVLMMAEPLLALVAQHPMGMQLVVESSAAFAKSNHVAGCPRLRPRASTVAALAHTQFDGSCYTASVDAAGAVVSYSKDMYVKICGTRERASILVLGYMYVMYIREYIYYYNVLSISSLF
jgi:hypothetical protein